MKCKLYILYFSIKAKVLAAFCCNVSIRNINGVICFSWHYSSSLSCWLYLCKSKMSQGFQRRDPLNSQLVEYIFTCTMCIVWSVLERPSTLCWAMHCRRNFCSFSLIRALLNEVYSIYKYIKSYNVTFWGEKKHRTAINILDLFISVCCFWFDIYSIVEVGRFGY